MSKIFDRLTPKEREVAVLVSNGLCNKLIARKLDIAEATVKVYIKRIFRVLDTNSRTQLTVLLLTGERRWLT